MNIKKLLLLLALGSFYVTSFAQTPTEVPTFTDEFTVGTKDDLNMDFQNALTTYQGSIYYGYVDVNLNACISKKDVNGIVTTKVIFTNNVNDPHNSISIAIDAEGYIHYAGNMHQTSMVYYRSNNPDDISNFTMLNSNTANGGMFGGVGISYGRFSQSRKGTLFFVSRQRVGVINDGFVAGCQGGHIQKYDTDTKKWKQLGSLNYSFTSDKGAAITGGMDANHQVKVVFWDNSGAGVPPNNAYQGHKIRILFDKNNRMHMAWNIAKNPARTTVSDTHTHLLYAYSDDEGETWKKSDGTALSFPITTATGEIVYFEDPNVNDRRLFNFCNVMLTSDNKPIIMQYSYTQNKVLCFRLSGSVWIEENAKYTPQFQAEGWIDDNNWMTMMTSSGRRRSNDNFTTSQSYNTNPQNGASLSLDYQYMLETGRIRYTLPAAGGTTTIKTLEYTNSAPGQVEPPSITPTSGSTFVNTAIVTMVTYVFGADIRYTLDGTMPTATTGTLYTGPFTVNDTKTVKAIAFASGKVTSRLSAVQLTKATLVPLQLILFTAESVKNNSTKLLWETQNEINVKGFEIEVSNDGTNFQKQPTFINAGKTNYSYTYKFLDATKKYFFRLKMIDKDGAFTYSKVIVINPNTSGILITPNPARDFIKVTIPDTTIGPFNVVILANNGKQVVSKKIHSSSIINLPQLVKGKYNLVIYQNQNLIKSTGLIIQ